VRISPKNNKCKKHYIKIYAKILQVIFTPKTLECYLPKTISLGDSGSVELFSTSAAVADIYKKNK